MMIEYSIIFILLCLVGLQGWWIYKSLKKFILMRDLYNEVDNALYEYVEHLQSVHDMERFYGEPVLERLVEHGKETVTTVNQFLEVFEDFEEEGELNLSRIYDSDEEQLDYDPEN